MHNVQVTPLIGLPQFNGWSQVVVNHDLTVTVALSVTGQNAGNIGRDLVAQIKETSPASVEAFYRLLQDLKLDTEELGVILALSAAYISGTAISYATLRGTVILKRGEKVGKLVSSDDHLQLIQGKTADDDVVVLATQAAGSFLGEIQQKATQGYAPDIIIKSLAPAIHKEPDTAALSIGFMVFGKEVTEAPETTPGSVVALDEHIPSVEKPSILHDTTFPRNNESEGITPLGTSRVETELSASAIPRVSQSVVSEPLFPRLENDEPPVSDVPPIPTDKKTVNSSFSKTLETQSSAVHVPSVSFSQRLQPLLKTGQSIGFQVGQGLRRLVITIGKVFHRQTAPPQIAAHSVMSPSTTITSASTTAAQAGMKTHPFGSPPAFVPPDRSKQTKLLGVLLVIAIGSVGVFGVWRQRQAHQVSAAQTELNSLLSDFAVAQSQIESDPVTARTRMLEVINQIEQVKNKYQGQTAAQTTITKELVTVRQTYDSLSGKQELQELPVWFDLASVQSGFLATKVVGDDQSLLAIDQEKKEMLIVQLADKAHQLRTVTQLPARSAFNLTGNSLLMLGGGIQELDISQVDSQWSRVVEEGDSNREASLLAHFHDFLYVLNPSKRNIYRYLRDGEKVSEPIGWIKPGQPLPYENISGFKIDGDVWLATTDGQVIKFTSGDRQDFTITGLAQPFKGPIMLDTREGLTNLYILEPSNRRVVVVSKNGQFLKEIRSPSLATASDLVADENHGRVLAVSGSLIFEVSI